VKKILYLSAAIALGGFMAILLATPIGKIGASALPNSHLPALEYLKSVNRVGPPQDPQLLFVLMAEYANANEQAEGAAFFSERLSEFKPRLTNAQQSLYLSAIGLLRAQNARKVPLLHRIGYVKDTIAMLSQAKQLSGGRIFVVNWIAGVVHAQLPGFFHQRQMAQEELTWCVANADKAPHVGWLREVYHHLALLANAEGDQTKAQTYLQRSGYTNLQQPITLITPFSEDPMSGHTFSPRHIAEIVPHRVYALSGFEFTEYYFVVSDDGQQLIGIDAGTRPDSAKEAYEALRAYAPDLPKLTTIFITHSHWDHIGGHAYFRSLNPDLHIYARSNYQDEVAHDLEGPERLEKHFFGERFTVEDVRNFKPDVLVDRRREVTVGGTPIELIPVDGGETRDALFVHVPRLGVLFVGDFIMPYLGAPFVPEGDLQGLLDAIDVVVQIQPKRLLHGHQPLTQNFASSSMLAELKTDLTWLREQVLVAIRRGDERALIYEANLTPPGLLHGTPDAYMPYLLLREHVIDRLFAQNTGYWRADLQGVDHLGRADRAELLVDYLHLSERQLLETIDRLGADGKWELAASLLDSCRSRFARSESVAKAERLVYLKLMEKNQNTDPFKFILYSAKIGEQVPQMGDHAEELRDRSANGS
jgi:glyoxylase-like metal-dependent hydrolase (beta-lactamase superfamily II)